ncbi:MAG: hypothetical protein IJ428_01260 [Clostridia bacterium]|nr:hypothetical protein [Clostridia bacterium]
MTNSKTTKRALFSSVVALLLCFTMLLGTTFAWFTDSAASGSNVITAGNLDIVVEYTLDGTNWNNLDGATDLFQKGLWEPGHTEVVALRIKNNGTLALKYAANMNIVSETTGKTKDNADIVLSDILTVSTLIQQAADKDGVANQIGDITLGLAFNGENSVAYQNTTTFKAGNVLGNDEELEPGAAHYLIVKVDMAESVGNEANHDGTHIPTINFGINVLATQFTYENDSFGNQYDKDSTYPVVDTMVTAANLATVDFTEENTKFVFSGTFDAVTISELGDGSVIDFDNATVGVLTIQDDAVLTGNATIESLTGVRNDSTPIEMTISDATLDIAGDLNVKNTMNGSVLNIVDSSVECAFLFVGEHTNNATAALAEFNVINSYLRCEENSMGSTISVWGRSGVKSTIYDSEIHTYSRGWHSSEDANDNAITFQGATSIDVDIQRSNIHTYGYRSIINARQYGSEATTINASIDDSFIWVITKSTHDANTVPVWGFDSITDTALVFTKNVAASVDQVVDSSFVYGNPVIHGNFNLHSNCNCSWDAHVALDDETVTFAADANVSVDDACIGSLTFVLSDTAKIVVEDGATVSGKVNIVAADGYTLNTVTENGVTTYSVSAN